VIWSTSSALFFSGRNLATIRVLLRRIRWWTFGVVSTTYSTNNNQIYSKNHYQICQITQIPAFMMFSKHTKSLYDIQNDAESLTSLQMIEQERYCFFLYSHPRDTKEHIHCTAGNFLNKNKDMSIIFAMSMIGIKEFADVIDKEPYMLTKNKKYTNVFHPPSSVLHQELLQRAHFIMH
jgi:hypothetical protein